MPFSTDFSNDILKFLLNGDPMPTYGDDTNFYLSLHTASPTPSGTQSTNECTYTGYTRLATLRDMSEWTVTDNAADAANSYSFPANAGVSTDTVAYIAIGVLSSGGGQLIDYRALGSPRTLSPGDSLELSTVRFVLTVTE